MHFTSIKQSRKLIKLGLDVSSADMCYEYNVKERVYSIEKDTCGYVNKVLCTLLTELM